MMNIADGSQDYLQCMTDIFGMEWDGHCDEQEEDAAAAAARLLADTLYQL